MMDPRLWGGGAPVAVACAVPLIVPEVCTGPVEASAFVLCDGSCSCLMMTDISIASYRAAAAPVVPVHQSSMQDGRPRYGQL